MQLFGLFLRRRKSTPRDYIVTFPDGRTTVLRKEGREWEVLRLDEGEGSTAIYTTLREARESLTDAGCCVDIASRR